LEAAKRFSDAEARVQTFLSEYTDELRTRNWAYANVSLRELESLEKLYPGKLGLNIPKLQKDMLTAKEEWKAEIPSIPRQIVMDIALGRRSDARSKLKAYRSGGGSSTVTAEVEDLLEASTGTYAKSRDSSELQAFARLYYKSIDHPFLFFTDRSSGSQSPARAKQIKSDNYNQTHKEISNGILVTPEVTQTRNGYDVVTTIRHSATNRTSGESMEVNLKESLQIKRVNGGYVIESDKRLDRTPVNTTVTKRYSAPSTEKEQIRSMVIDYLDAGDSSSTADQARFFLPTVANYFGKKRVSQEKIRREITAYNDTQSFRDFELKDLKLNHVGNQQYKFWYVATLSHSSGEKKTRAKGMIVKSGGSWKFESLLSD